MDKGAALIINHPNQVTHLEVWAPKYSTRWSELYHEKVALLHREKVNHATLNIIVEFTKAKSLEDQRFAISKNTAQAHEIGTNGAAPNNMYVVPMSHFESWVSGDEVVEEVKNLGW